CSPSFCGSFAARKGPTIACCAAQPSSWRKSAKQQGCFVMPASAAQQKQSKLYRQMRPIAPTIVDCTVTIITHTLVEDVVDPETGADVVVEFVVAADIKERKRWCALLHVGTEEIIRGLATKTHA